MSDFPYTDEQKVVFHEAASDLVGLDTTDTSLILRGLHERGITVAFPEPRYYVSRDTDRAGVPRWYVRDRMDDGLNVAWFYGHGPETHAREHADRLNSEDSP